MLKKGDEGVDVRFDIRFDAVPFARQEVNHRDEQNWQISRELAG